MSDTRRERRRQHRLDRQDAHDQLLGTDKLYDMLANKFDKADVFMGKMSYDYKDINNYNKQIDGLKERIREVEEELRSVDPYETREEKKEKIRGFKKQIKKFENEITHSQRKIKEFEDEVEKHMNHAEELKGKIKKFEKSLTRNEIDEYRARYGLTQDDVEGSENGDGVWFDGFARPEPTEEEISRMSPDTYVNRVVLGQLGGKKKRKIGKVGRKTKKNKGKAMKGKTMKGKAMKGKATTLKRQRRITLRK